MKSLVKLFLMAIAFVAMVIIGGLAVMRLSSAATVPNPFGVTLTAPTVSPDFVTYKAGDLLVQPVRKGNFMLLLYGSGGPRLWYDAQYETFGIMPIRNYSTIYMDITRKTPPGDYQLVEIEAAQDPTKLENWQWIKVNNVRIVLCDGFSLC